MGNRIRVFRTTSVSPIKSPFFSTVLTRSLPAYQINYGLTSSQCTCIRSNLTEQKIANCRRKKHLSKIFTLYREERQKKLRAIGERPSVLHNNVRTIDYFLLLLFCFN